MDKAAWTLKQVKTFRGREGTGFNANLYRDGNKVATVDDHGNGGPIDVHFLDGNGHYNVATPESTLLDAHVKALPQEKCFGTMLDVSVESFLGSLFDDVQEEKRLRRLCKTKIVLKLKSNKPGEVTCISQAYRPVHKAKLEERYGGDLVEIINERYL